MLLLPAYAVILWYLIAQHRRTWRGFAIVAGGFLFLVLVAYFHWLLSKWTHGAVFLPTLQAVLYPYTVLVGVIGFYICCVSRRHVHGHCQKCRYDLAGLEGTEIICPECGLLQKVVDDSPAKPAVQQSHEERQDRQARDEEPLRGEERAATQGPHDGKQPGGGALGDHGVLVREPGDARFE